jgi:hypothetical protein
MNGTINLSPAIDNLEVDSISQTDSGTQGFVLSGNNKIAFTTKNGDFIDVKVNCRTNSAGDVNSNGIVNMVDVQKVINGVLQIEDFNICYDINSDGKLDQKDIDKLINALN